MDKALPWTTCRLETEPVVIGAKCDASKGLRCFCNLFDGGLHNVVQIVLEFLLVGQLPYMVNRLYLSPRRPYKNQFETETILASHNLFLARVVIGRGAQVAKNHLWNPQARLWMLRDVDAIAVVLYRDSARLVVDGNLYVCNELDRGLCLRLRLRRRLHTHHMVPRIHDTLIKQLVETWHKFHHLSHNPL